MHKIFASAFAVAALAAATPALAQTTEAVTVSVETQDLDLTAAADQEKLNDRIETAILRACRPDGRDAIAMRASRVCRSSLADAFAPRVELAIAEAGAVRLASIDLEIGA